MAYLLSEWQIILTSAMKMYIIQENDYYGPFETYYFKSEQEANKFLDVKENDKSCCKDWCIFEKDIDLVDLIYYKYKGKFSTIEKPRCFFEDW